MPFKGTRKEKKNAYIAKLIQLCESKPMALLISVNHVGSSQMQEIRIALRGKATILMGKNTTIRTALRNRIEETEDEGLQRLLESINGNLGFVFLEDPCHLESIREVIEGNKVPAMAKAGSYAQCDVVLPAGPSGLEPSQTSFFQAMNVPTKIVKGMIEITSDVKLVTKDEKVSLSAQTLLAKMGIKPFEYGMLINHVYQDGAVFDAAVLDIDPTLVAQKFSKGVRSLAAFSLGLYYPTQASIPHTFSNTLKQAIAICLMGEYTFKYAEPYKAFLDGKSFDEDEEEEEGGEE